MFISSTILTGTFPHTVILDACVVLGVVGALFAIAAAILSAHGACIAATWMLLLSCACAVTGAFGIIAGTQSWAATVITSVCTAGVLGVVLCTEAQRQRNADAEAFT